jgi:hypothetical protein
MDIHRLLNSPRTPRALRPATPTPCTPTKKAYSQETTRSDRIRIKSGLKFATPRTVYRTYRDEYGYSLRQIQFAQTQPDTPKRSKRCGRKPVIPIEKARELKEWLLSDPAHRFVPFHYLPTYAPDLGLQGYGFEAIRTAFLRVGYGRRVAKRKGFSDDPAVIAKRLAFAREGITWSPERLFRQAFSDEVWAHGGAFTQSFVTVLIEGEPDDIRADRYRPECLQHKYSKQPAWMFHGSICGGRKGPGTFWEKEWGTMNSAKYNEIILSQVQPWFESARAQGVRLVWQHDGASCHTSFETEDNLYRRNIPTINWPPYSPDLNLIEHVWTWMKRYIQRNYFQVYYNAQSVPEERLRQIIWEAWNAVPDSFIETLYYSWWERCQAVIDAQGGPTKY